jgi:hypothetical protein
MHVQSAYIMYFKRSTFYVVACITFSNAYLCWIKYFCYVYFRISLLRQLHLFCFLHHGFILPVNEPRRILSSLRVLLIFTMCNAKNASYYRYKGVLKWNRNMWTGGQKDDTHFWSIPFFTALRYRILGASLCLNNYCELTAQWLVPMLCACL